MTKILFVCRGNMFRSQVAEALFKHEHQSVKHRVFNTLVQSCGTWVEEKGLICKKVSIIVKMKNLAFISGRG